MKTVLKSEKDNRIENCKQRNILKIQLMVEKVLAEILSFVALPERN